MSVVIKTKKNPKITTKNSEGKVNGFLVPILNTHEGFVDPEQWPQQAYLTVAKVGEVKGPHLHKKRWGLFTCIKGNIRIVLRNNGVYEEYFSGEDHDFATIQVPAGVPGALQNIGQVDAYVLNLPSPAWHVDDQDEWDVEFEDYDFSAGPDSSA